MGNGVTILADDGNNLHRSANANISIAGDVGTAAVGSGFTVTGKVSVGSTAAAAWGQPMSAGLLDDPEFTEEGFEDMPLDEARRIAVHRQREIEGFLGD